MIGYLIWDPNPDLFLIPLLNHPIRWYGLCFAIGFLIAYRIVAHILYRRLRSHPRFTDEQVVSEEGVREAVHEGAAGYVQEESGLLAGLNKVIEKGDALERRETLEAQLGASVLTLKQLADKLADRLAWFVVVGTIVGARLGHCLFYDWPRYSANPLQIARVWEGGLASHGGAVGILLAIFLFYRYSAKDYPWLTPLVLFDTIAVSAGFAGFCIRIGNFINQEIFGTQTAVPWGVVFMHPMDGSAAVPRHPVQLYEAGCYLLIFFVMWSLWQRYRFIPGKLTGLFLVLTFGVRFCLEFFKQSQTLLSTALNMGQWLSVPFVLFGLLLMFLPRKGSQQLVAVV